MNGSTGQKNGLSSIDTPDFEFCFRGFLGPLELMGTLQEALTLVQHPLKY